MDCGKCGGAIQAPCPCGTCDVITTTPMCPRCEPDRFGKWNKAHGVKVCEDYLRKALDG